MTRTAVLTVPDALTLAEVGDVADGRQTYTVTGAPVLVEHLGMGGVWRVESVSVPVVGGGRIEATFVGQRVSGGDYVKRREITSVVADAAPALSWLIGEALDALQPHVTVYATEYAEWEEGADERARIGTEENRASMVPDAFDVAEGETPVSLAVAYLWREGIAEPSSTGWRWGTWYREAAPYTHPYTGVLTERSAHLGGFTPDEERAVFDGIAVREQEFRAEVARAWVRDLGYGSGDVAEVARPGRASVRRHGWAGSLRRGGRRHAHA
jgi:hypothetical protein